MVDIAAAQQPSMGARLGVGTAPLTWRTLRVFLRCYDNPHVKDEMEQCLVNWKWVKTIPETKASFHDLVYVWTQTAQQTATLDFARQIETPTPHAILTQIVNKMPQWVKKAHAGPPKEVSLRGPALDFFERGGHVSFDSVIYGQHQCHDSYSP